MPRVVLAVVVANTVGPNQKKASSQEVGAVRADGNPPASIVTEKAPKIWKAAGDHEIRG